MQELLRPWKLLTFSLGIGLMIFGALQGIAMDWDLGISILMPLYAYVTAPMCVRVLVDRRWHLLPLVVFSFWFGVDGIYTMYWGWQRPEVLPLLREANFIASAPLYALCGMGWLYRGSLADLMRDLHAALESRPRAD